MWWDYQNLNKPRRDKSGKRLNFRVWHEVVELHHRVRVFFWDDQKGCCGVRIFRVGDDTHITALHCFIEKLTASATLRDKYRRNLDFPLERHYSMYGVFPEEDTEPKVK